MPQNPTAPVDLQDFVDAPAETPDVEYKAWIDVVGDRAAKAKLAKHLCALANHGGGYLVFGFNDDLTPADRLGAKLDTYTSDTIGDIIDRYLDPSFHCDVRRVVASKTGLEFPVVRVPSHASVPVCAKQNGPEQGGQVVGVRQGVHYVRAAGRPKSVPIDREILWRPVIHRAVLHERASLLAGITRLFTGVSGSPAEVEGSKSLEQWHEDSHADFLAAIEEEPFEWPVPLANNHCQMSFMIDQDGAPDILGLEELHDAIRVAAEATKEYVWATYLNMFHQSHRTETAPRVGIYARDGTETELYEARFLGQRALSSTLPDFWRVTVDGRATTIRPYREDYPRDKLPTEHAEAERLLPGTFLSPSLLARDLFELAAFAQNFAKAYPKSVGITFRGSWYGLANRRIDDFDAEQDWGQRTAHVDRRTVTATRSVGETATQLPELAAELGNPVLALFDGLKVTPGWVRLIAPQFRADVRRH